MTVVLMVEVLLPLATMLVGLALTTRAVGAPAVKLTLASPVAEPEVALTLASPALVLLVKTTVATPLALVVELAWSRLPAVVVQFTVTPAATVLPCASLTVALRVDVLLPLASMAAG